MARMVKVRGERVGCVVEGADRQGDEDRAKDRRGGDVGEERDANMTRRLERRQI